jgi:N-acetylglutamate synthase/N-acetylornithine aminotransferase
MNISEKLESFIAENGGNERNALNIALAKIETLNADLLEVCEELKRAVDYYGEGSYPVSDIWVNMLISKAKSKMY